MVTLLGRRLLATIPLLFLVSLVVFALVHALPGDPAVLFLGEEADPETLARFRVRLGLDRPLVAQYAAWLGRALRGDLGRSLRTNQPVAEAILERLPVTLELLVAALSVSLAIAIPMGIVSAVKRNSGVDLVSTVFALVGFAMPGFWLGIILIYVFALLLRWLPPSGWVPLPASVPQNLLSLVLPAFTLGTALAALVTRQLRSGMLEVLRQDYVRTAQAKGLSERQVVGKHALKNALISVVTVVGLQLGGLLGNTIITETLFALPGVGRLMIDAIFSRDFFVVQGVILFLAVGYVLSNLLVDVLYSYLDPRIRLH
ncbi:MAG: peptide ABC transporter [Candidatus Rokubacteria bacterium 13_1_40CM_4_69_39]|nr:MAG: peptide ABC transporter [Candidatus Rokubacteria bacterium 13_1_40CM_69_96]OLC51617.1 MAG: peptide ABC transporter [Candidatus Rokubacteria bacterium 13_1_40CM_4_69_39]PYM46968.1 MAG: peptide ABC transporter [Candidatus Rokubacteria bacterium]